MSKTPSVPKEQRSFADHGARPIGDMADRRDLATGAQSGQPGDADVNTGQQGRFGNLKQNLTTQWKTQDVDPRLATASDGAGRDETKGAAR